MVLSQYHETQCRPNYVYIFTRKTSSKAFVYKLDFIHIALSQCVKDLGVILDSKVQFLNHVDHLVVSLLKS